MANETNTEELESTAVAGDEEFQFVEEPKFEVNYKGDCAYEVKVAVPTANEKKKADDMFAELRKEAELPGFRRGRAPLRLVERKFSKAVKSDVAGKLVTAAFQKLIKDEDLNPIGYPDIDGLEDAMEREEGQPLEFTLKFDVAPRVELGKYRGIEIERPFIKIDDQDVDESIEELLERHATYETLEGGVAAEGDQAIIDFKGESEGEDIPGGKADNYPYLLGSQRFFPEFEKALLGSSPGDELTCKVTFPDDYFAEELRGKKGTFSIKVHEVKRKRTPELTEEFAKESGYDSLDDMREKVKKQLEEAAESRSKQLVESQALEKVVESSTFEIPKRMIDAVAHQHKEDEVKRLMGLRIPLARIEEQMPELEKSARDSALHSIKSMVTLNEIGEAEGIEVTEEDFEKEAETVSKAIGADVDLVAQYMAQEDQRGPYVDRIYRSKAMSVIIENAKITDKELTRDEIEGEGEEKAGTGKKKKAKPKSAKAKPGKKKTAKAKPAKKKSTSTTKTKAKSKKSTSKKRGETKK